MTIWREEVKAALYKLGGEARLEDIYAQILSDAPRTLPKAWQAIIRRELEYNSSDSESYQGRFNLFYSVDGIGSGVWGLRDPAFMPSPIQGIESFEAGKIYHRQNDIHRIFGGQEQGGITTPASHPFIFLFATTSAETYGYADHFIEDGAFLYTGEGQIGHMEMARGNLALNQHRINNKRVFVFEGSGNGLARYMGEAICLGYEQQKGPDKNGEMRDTFVFSLAFLTASNDDLPNQMSEDEPTLVISKNLPLDKLRELALKKSSRKESIRELKKSVWIRSEAVRLYALKRARGICEGCKIHAPFVGRDGPFLEIHHTTRLCDGGPDLPAHVIALCPNCHRRVHNGVDGKKYNEALKIELKQIESLT